jgi:hypothetical protein
MNSGLGRQGRRADQGRREKYFSFHKLYILCLVYCRPAAPAAWPHSPLRFALRDIARKLNF